MKLPRVRSTVRRMMVAVAIAAAFASRLARCTFRNVTHEDR